MSALDQPAAPPARAASTRHAVPSIPTRSEDEPSTRLALVAWAESQGAWILEDDYDSEFRYTGRPLGPLYTLTDSGRVIHVGTFSKVLFSGMRLGYMVVPRGLVGAFRTLRGFHDRGSPVLLQSALSLFMREGRYQKHIRRLRSLYAERRDALVLILPSETGNLFRVASPDAGLHLVGRLAKGVSDVDFAKSAMDCGVCTLPLSQMAELPQDEGALVLGFAGITPEEMVEGARALRRAFERMSGGDAKMAGG